MIISKKRVQKAKNFVVKHKTAILTGALVVVLSKNRSLKRENAELQSTLDSVVADIDEAVAALELNTNLFGQFFGPRK